MYHRLLLLLLFIPNHTFSSSSSSSFNRDNVSSTAVDPELVMFLLLDVGYGSDLVTDGQMLQHQKSSECRLKFTGALLSYATDEDMLISLETDSILARPPYSNLSTTQAVLVPPIVSPPCSDASIL